MWLLHVVRLTRVQVVTLDLSFISVLKVLPAIAALLPPAGHLVSLIKPQFEARREEVRPPPPPPLCMRVL